jgi:hypothetical protein
MGELQTGGKSRQRLAVLARHGREAHARTADWNWSDDLAHLSSERRAAWARVLSSLATAESIEETVLLPMVEGLRHDSEAVEYIKVHGRDEERHFKLLSRYLRNTFGYRKKHRTLTDRMIYDGVLPRLVKSFRRKPIPGLAMIHAYEKISLPYYAALRREAQADGAQNLVTLIRIIEKDELRHVAGVEALLGQEIARNGGLSWLDQGMIRGVLQMVRTDADLGPWAFHNRELRTCIERLGIDADALMVSFVEAMGETLEVCGC